MRARQHGFNLIELLITFVVLAVLIGLGAPSFSDWLQNQQIRAAAEATLNGLQAARSEAVARNTNVSFQFMTDLSPTCVPAPIGAGINLTSMSWVVSLGDPSGSCDKNVGDVPPGPVIQSRSGFEGTPGAVVATLPNGATTVTFTALGATTSNPDGSLPLLNMTVSSSVLTGPTARPLKIVINPGGSTRLCDPNAVAPDTRACP
jgi:type IV fimbrial biogenesis protein FimT